MSTPPNLPDAPERSATQSEEIAAENTVAEVSAPGADAPLVGDVAPDDTPAPPKTTRPGEPGYLTPPDDIVAGAKVAPDHWLTMIDPNWVGEEGEDPPSWVRIGRWRTDSEGEIVEWERNEEYRPSPDTLDWPTPGSPLDSALQLTATGYMEEDVFHLVLADAEVAVCTEQDGSFKLTAVPDGPATVPVFPPSARMDPDEVPPHTLMTIPDLLQELAKDDPRQILVLSSTAPVGQIVQPDVLRVAYADLQKWRKENPEDFAELDALRERVDARGADDADEIVVSDDLDSLTELDVDGGDISEDDEADTDVAVGVAGGLGATDGNADGEQASDEDKASKPAGRAPRSAKRGAKKPVQDVELPAES
ncbi:type VII secretion system-associated protein [Streptomyces sp. NPDC020681]|uniref:type VII secretion system-associated protein n=1 Tax=Streptomyces sp. NPDC020681 TaxID=3365083 RepID=UPI0037ADDA59